MATIGTGNFGKLLWPGLNAIWGKSYNEWPTEYTDIFETYKSDRHYEEDLGVTSYGLLQNRAEGAPVMYDSERQTFVTRYTHAEYALGFVITKVMFEDDLYNQVGERRAKGLAFSSRQTKEIIGANVLNRAFTSTYAGGDGKELLATDHPNWAGGTWSNELATPADLSEASLEQAVMDIAAFTNDRGLKIKVMPRKLIVPMSLAFEAERILKSPARVGTPNNDLNALKTMGKFPGGYVVNHYLTDADAWFIKTDAQNGMKHFERVADTFAQDNDFDTSNAKFMVRGRYSFGWTDAKSMFGSPGA